MKRSHIIAIGAGSAVFVFVVGGLIYLFSQRDVIVKAAIEKYGTEITGTAVTLSDVEIDTANWKVTLKGLAVANPEGFEGKNAFSVETASVSLKKDTSFSLIEIEDVLVDGSLVSYEEGQGGSNIKTIKNNIDAYVAKHGGGDQSTGEGEAESGVKLIVDNIRFQNGKVVMKSILTEGQVKEQALPAIHLRNLGKAKGGATPGEVGKEAAAAVAEKALAVAVKTGVTDKLKEKLGLDPKKDLMEGALDKVLGGKKDDNEGG